jgi:alpha-D-xyloside xylohydrolase
LIGQSRSVCQSLDTPVKPGYDLFSYPGGIMKKQLVHLFILIVILISWHCSTYQGKVKQVKNGAQVELKDLNVMVQFYADNSARIVKWIPGSTAEKKSLVVIKTISNDLDVVVQEDDRSVNLTTGKMKIIISRIDGAIKYLRPDNTTILLENGKALFSPVVYQADSGYTMQQNFKLTADEGVYGLGQHQDGYMNYRGKKVVLVQSNTDAVNPFLVSTQLYGILWDNYSKTVFEDHEQGASLWSDIGDHIDYYFVAGRSMDEVIAGYRDLTGQAPMYGKWAYGYWQSKEHYENRDELLSIAQQYRRRQIPIDNIIQDWDYWDGQENWGQLYFAETKFPQPEQMIKMIHDMNYHIMISIWPGLGPNTAVYKEMDKHGYLFWPIGWANFKYYDAYVPEANNIYWKYMKNGLYSKGIDAWWIDSTEPDIINATAKDAQEFEMKKVCNSHLGSWARYLNTYSLLMTQSIYENQRKENDKQRVYILTRSSFAGQQRSATTTWSGDIGASWDVYKKQISAGINFSMAGIPYWTFDIGAFVLGAYDGVFCNGGKDPAYQELYARMFQFGAFCPIFRSHGSETPREIWEFGEFEKPMLKFDNLRYRLLPYIYALAWKITNDGYTIMRGLPMDFFADKNTYDIDDQFMFGPTMMVCPVTEYQIHRPPEKSVLIAPEYFKTDDGRQGLVAKYYKDAGYKTLALEHIDPNVNIRWYTGRPDYATDSTYAIRWQGKLIPKLTGKHQFHLKSYDPKRIILDGKELPIVYTSVEQYTDVIELEAGKEYNFIMEVENNQRGAAKAELFWKTPDMFEREQMKEQRDKTRSVYLPADHEWIDFWTGEIMDGGQMILADAPIDKIPLLVKAGSILPMGPFLEYATEKPADPIELRIYPGADCEFVLYEDENDNYNYEKGVYSTIKIMWDDANRVLTVDERKGEFPGMLTSRQFAVVLVSEDHGVGVEVTKKADRLIIYSGKKISIAL